MEKTDIKTFYDLCQKYLIWIIQYKSATFDKPLYLVWYTDESKEQTDRFLTFKNGSIFSVESLSSLETIILNESDNLNAPDNLISWLDNFKYLDPEEDCTLDLVYLVKEIEENYLSAAVLDSFVQFVNLFGDYIYQDERNTHLVVYKENEVIEKVWDYYYNNFFWSRPDGQESEEFSVDTRELLLRLKDIINSFENYLSLEGKI